jgi:hypothetical protein
VRCNSTNKRPNHCRNVQIDRSILDSRAGTEALAEDKMPSQTLDHLNLASHLQFTVKNVPLLGRGVTELVLKFGL